MAHAVHTIQWKHLQFAIVSSWNCRNVTFLGNWLKYKHIQCPHSYPRLNLLSYFNRVHDNKRKIYSEPNCIFLRQVHAPSVLLWFCFVISKVRRRLKSAIYQKKEKKSLFCAWWHSRDVNDTFYRYVICTLQQKQHNISICKEPTCTFLWNTSVWLCGHRQEELTSPSIKPSSLRFFLFFFFKYRRL